MDGYTCVALSLVAFSLGAILGHLNGYAKAVRHFTHKGN
jgi:hypothetical protein